MFKGTYVAVPTPFTNGKIDEACYAKYLEYIIASGIEGIIVCGSTGESATLSMDEHIAMIRLSKDIVNKRIKIVGSAGSNNTEESVFLIKEVEKLDIDGALCITPYYNKPTQRGLYAHYEKLLTNSSRIEIIVYNVPSRTGVNIAAETVIDLAKFDRITALKEALPDFEKVTKIVMDTDSSFSVLSGDDMTLLPLLAVGGKGVISVIGNLLPKTVINMIDAFNKGDLVKARQLNSTMFELNKVLFVESNPIPVKYALSKMGHLNNELRLPLLPLDKIYYEKLDKALKTAGLI